MKTFLLILACFGTACAQVDKPIFKSDTMSPQLGGAAGLLEAVCPGSVIVGDKVTCRDACRTLPGFNQDTADWEIVGVLRGHFLAGDSEDAVLAQEGCLDHASHWGGSILLTKRTGIWKQVWFKSGLITKNCHKVSASDGRDLLVCELEDWHQSFGEQDLAVIDLKSPKGNDDAMIFRATDSVKACGGVYAGVEPPDPHAVHSYIERVDFTEHEMTIYASWGIMKLTNAQLKDCENKRYQNVPTKLFKVGFLFDGKTYRLDPASRNAAKLFSEP